ncbi:hypothetical protein BGY98DRAFT_1011023 [Russula aff. rugulosa BPL654]|nr:hypothetical protein BGY98DRAFT_1011023 [Russula aff. rugulosa BPL654]
MRCAPFLTLATTCNPMSNMFKVSPALVHLVHIAPNMVVVIPAVQRGWPEHPSAAADTMIGPILLSMAPRAHQVIQYIRVQATLSHLPRDKPLRRYWF